jgi:hypothetical protein
MPVKFGDGYVECFRVKRSPVFGKVHRAGERLHKRSRAFVVYGVVIDVVIICKRSVRRRKNLEDAVIAFSGGCGPLLDASCS